MFASDSRTFTTDSVAYFSLVSFCFLKIFKPAEKRDVMNEVYRTHAAIQLVQLVVISIFRFLIRSVWLNSETNCFPPLESGGRVQIFGQENYNA